MKALSRLLLITTIVVAGCSKGYYDVNTNPNASTNASVDLVLSNALKTTAQTPINAYQFLSEWLGYWAPSGSFAISASDASSYKETTDYADLTAQSAFQLWTGFYNNLEDYQYIEDAATKNNQYFYVAAAKTMKAFVYQQMVDMFNNVPYSHALKGAANLTPAYDKAKDVYEALSTDLGQAVKLFQRPD